MTTVKPAVRQQPVLTLDSALTLVGHALTEAAALDLAASITIVDPSMNLLAFAKADGATPHSVDSSRRKANTAASTRRATGWMGDDLALPLPLATDLRLTNIIGGAPLVVDGVVVGAIGIAGGTPAQDAQVAAATAARTAEL
ncbi:MAG: heme-binding protein [Pseudonocardiales bacterium]|nr:heme-binding protein [Pseudonocardiales bacterium]